MTAPLSPDEGVRAALCPGCGNAAERNPKKPDRCGWCGHNYATGQAGGFKPASAASDEVEDDRCLFCGRDPFHYVDIGVGMQPAAVVCCEEGIAHFSALSTPDPEEGLPRGSASAAVVTDEVRDLAQRMARQLAFHIEDSDNGLSQVPRHTLHLVRGLVTLLAAPAAEAGDGVASALPSPLPSQGEPVLWVSRRALQGIIDGSRTGVLTSSVPSNIMAVSVPLYTSEALAAERARADELKGLYGAAIQMYRHATDREGRLRVALSAEGSGTIAAARKQAAEEMRERAAKVLDIDYFEVSPKFTRALARTIRALPLPSSPEDHEKATATPTISDPDGEANHG